MCFVMRRIVLYENLVKFLVYALNKLFNTWFILDDWTNAFLILYANKLVRIQTFCFIFSNKKLCN